MCMVLGQNKKLDMKKLYDMALIHDLGETATSDIRFEEGKEIIAPESSKHEIEYEILKRILPATGKGDYYISLWEEFRDQETNESKFLKQVEKLEMCLQALEYEENGHPARQLDEFWENTEKYLVGRKLEPFYRELEKMRAKLTS